MISFRDLLTSVKNKSEELKERKEFVDMVEAKAKPIRRKAYMEQMLKEVVNEGIAKAKADAKARLPKEQKTEKDFGFAPVENWGFLNKPEPKPKTPNKSKGKKK